MFSPNRDKIDDFYASIQAYFKIKYDGDLNNYLEIELDRWPDSSTHLSQSYISQSKINMIVGIENLNAKRTTAAKPLPSEK